jgi:hypothetical protein
MGGVEVEERGESEKKGGKKGIFFLLDPNHAMPIQTDRHERTGAGTRYKSNMHRLFGYTAPNNLNWLLLYVHACKHLALTRHSIEGPQAERGIGTGEGHGPKRRYGAVAVAGFGPPPWPGQLVLAGGDRTPGRAGSGVCGPGSGVAGSRAGDAADGGTADRPWTGAPAMWSS